MTEYYKKENRPDINVIKIEVKKGKEQLFRDCIDIITTPSFYNAKEPNYSMFIKLISCLPNNTKGQTEINQSINDKRSRIKKKAIEMAWEKTMKYIQKNEIKINDDAHTPVKLKRFIEFVFTYGLGMVINKRGKSELRGVCIRALRQFIEKKIMQENVSKRTSDILTAIVCMNLGYNFDSENEAIISDSIRNFCRVKDKSNLYTYCTIELKKNNLLMPDWNEFIEFDTELNYQFFRRNIKNLP